MKLAEKKIQSTLNELRGKALCFLSDITDIVYTECGYKTDDTPPSDGWVPFEKGRRISGSDKHFWFRLRFRYISVLIM